MVSEDPGPVQLSGDNVLLAPVRPDDTQFLYWLSMANEIGYRWRFRGVVLPYDAFVQQLHANVFAQFVVRRRADSDRVGHVIAYAADLRHGHAFIANICTPGIIGSHFGAESQEIFIQYLFDLWDLRKLYVEVPEFVYEGISSWIGDDVLKIEGRLTKHTYYKGRYWDQYILAIDRTAWCERETPFRRSKVTLPAATTAGNGSTAFA